MSSRRITVDQLRCEEAQLSKKAVAMPKRDLNDLLLTLTTRIVLPCVPIFIERLVALLVPSYTSPFPSRDVLVVAFLVPIVWIVEIRNRVVLLFACLFILFASVPFVCSLVSPSPRVYIAGLIIAVAAVLLFSSLEVASYFKTRVQVHEPERLDI